MSEFTPAQVDYIAAERANKEAVFGRDRMHAAGALGVLATAQTTQDFVNVVQDFCVPEVRPNTVHELLNAREPDMELRWLYRDDQKPLELRANFRSDTAVNDHIINSPAAVTTVHESQRLHPEGMRRGQYLVKERVYIGLDQKAYVARSLRRHTFFGNLLQPVEAVKRATETEVEAAISAVVDAKFQDSAIREKLPNLIIFPQE